MINLIVAHGSNNEIGYNNQLLWSLPTDLKRFKEITTGHTVVMGRKTFQSIGRPLPNRENIVLSKGNFKAEGVKVIDSIEPILKWATDREIYIIGGETIYKAFLPYADRLFITMVEGYFKADAYFPPYSHILENYMAIDYRYLKSDEKNKYDTRFIVYEKIQ